MLLQKDLEEVHWSHIRELTMILVGIKVIFFSQQKAIIQELISGLVPVAWGSCNPGIPFRYIYIYICLDQTQQNVPKFHHKFRNQKSKQHTLRGTYSVRNAIPTVSMYGIFSYIYHKNQPNVGTYTIHGSYGIVECNDVTSFNLQLLRDTMCIASVHSMAYIAP